MVDNGVFRFGCQIAVETVCLPIVEVDCLFEK